MLFLVGCNYRSASVELREKLAIPEAELPKTLARLKGLEAVDEVLVLSTCNRVEILGRSERSADEAIEQVRGYLREKAGIDERELAEHAYEFKSREAARHLFQVAAGLDSMILGEPQILGQVKQACRAAAEAGTVGPVLTRLYQQCLSTAKRIRTDTGISRHAVSVAFAAVGLARQIFGQLKDRKSLVLGAGKMGELVARHLGANEVGELFVASRTFSRSVASAGRVGGKPLPWEAGLERLSQVDIVVSCTGSQRIVLEKPTVVAALRKRRGQPLFLIDIAVPRDIDPAVNELDNVYLYDIDGLQDVVNANLEERREAARQAQREIQRDVAAFEAWHRSLEVTPTIVALRARVSELAEKEMGRYRGRLNGLSDDQRQVVQQMMRGLVQKILHGPVVHLRRSAERGDSDTSTALYREIFSLDPTQARGAEEGSDGRAARQPREAGPSRILKGGRES